VEDKEEKQIVDFASKEKLPLMTHDDYRKMIIKVQIMVDNAKDQQKGKVLEKEWMSEGDQLKQMDIWEDALLMVLLTGGHLEINVCDVAKIDRIKKQVMKYHWFEDTLFF